MTRSDREFLSQVEDAVARLFFLVNKIDHVPENQVARVLDDVEQKVNNTVSDGSKLREHAVFGISAAKAFHARCEYFESGLGVDRDRLRDPRVREALLKESRIAEFEDDLQHYLFGGGKGCDLLRNPLSFIQTETDRAKSDLRRQTGVLDDRFDVSALELDIEKMRRTVDERKHELAGATDELSDELSRALSEVEKALAEKCKLEEEALQDLLNAYDSVETLKQEWTDGVHIATLPGRKAVELERYASRSMNEVVDRVLRKVSRTVRRQISDELGELSVELPTFPELALHVQEPEDRSAAADNIKKKIEDIDRQLQEQEPKTVGEHAGEIRRLESVLQRETENYHYEIQQRGSRPEIRITERRTVDYKWGRGAVGIIKTILVGKKEVEDIEEVKDWQERRDHDRIREGLSKQHQAKIDDIERRVEEARGKLTAEMIARKRAETLEKVQGNYQQALKKEESRHRRAVADERTRAVEVTKNRVVSAFRDTMQSLKDVVGDSIGRTRNMAADFIAAVSEALDEGLKTNDRELEKLQSLKEQTECEREKSRRGIEASLQELSALRSDASQLAKQHTDFIQKTSDAGAGDSERG